MNGPWAEIATLACIHSIVALGLYIQVSSGQLNLGQAAFFGVGSYLGGITTAKLGLPFPVAVLAATLVTAAVAASFARLVLRLNHFFYAIATLALGEALVVLLQNTTYVGGSLGLRGIPWATTRPLIYGSFIVAVLLTWSLDRSRFMQGVRACGDDPEAAASIGCNPASARMVTAAISGGMAGYAGVVYVHYLTIVVPEQLNFAHSLDYLLFVAVGGMTTFVGPIAGTFAFSYLPEVLRFSAQDRFIIFGILLVVIMRVRPQGLIVRRRGRRSGGGVRKALDRLTVVSRWRGATVTPAPSTRADQQADTEEEAHELSPAQGTGSAITKEERPR